MAGSNDPVVTSGISSLRRDCVEAKEALSTDVDTDVPVALPGLNTTVRLTRGELETLITPAVLIVTPVGRPVALHV